MDYLTVLKEKINGYKSYNKAVKSEVLKQFSNRPQLTEDQYKLVLKRIPTVMKANKDFLIKVNKSTKKVYRLEVHAYAPELNTLYFNDGTAKRVPHKTTISEAVKYVISHY